jgi:competence protein ComEC
MMTNTAYEILWPTDPELSLRCACIYVGQGLSTLILASDGSGSYKTMLIDINLDQERGGTDVPKLLADLFTDTDGRLDCFVNTHPHDDHLSGITELNEVLSIGEVWHSGHKPGRKHESAHKALMKVIEAVEADGGQTVELRGSREPSSFGDVVCYVLAPADYVKDEIEDEDAETRYRRIHEQCAVLRFGVDDAWILITGDADRDAWEKHIAAYHGTGDENRIAAAVMTAPHHGSRTFFRYKEEDEPYEEAIELIEPKYVIISAPTQEESPHGHPHDDAVELYAQHVQEENVLHTGENRYCYICDVYEDGEYQITNDKGRLAEAYPLGTEEEDDNSGSKQKQGRLFPVSTVDQRPMGVM